MGLGSGSIVGFQYYECSFKLLPDQSLCKSRAGMPGKCIWFLTPACCLRTCWEERLAPTAWYRHQTAVSCPTIWFLAFSCNLEAHFVWCRTVPVGNIRCSCFPEGKKFLRRQKYVIQINFKKSVCDLTVKYSRLVTLSSLLLLQLED